MLAMAVGKLQAEVLALREQIAALKPAVPTVSAQPTLPPSVQSWIKSQAGQDTSLLRYLMGEAQSYWLATGQQPRSEGDVLAFLQRGGSKRLD